ncbi:GAF domain-containing sensor histidine kinase [Fulvivirga lutimaris]|uniref:GAF domain-containing sensor histidine kinase n=1 Tax=Fulvivirga lutimaris TaxID=1819566 RepID=UPI0012BB6366|nr:GAF domain-containing sensor histidine kinase [Fulvivirga lutimaris]MTI40867.1 GAF domain-containing sensor histidine kinase [Fulvivirga lutimaris]
MTAARIPDNEPDRIDELKEFNILDTEEEKAFDEIVELASYICGTPISLISLVDEKRQWFKAQKGLDVRETERQYSFCAHAILNDEIFEVEDASNDPRFEDNPLVTSSPNIRFYAGVPLKTKNGNNLGSLCVIDNHPKKIDDAQKRALQLLANRVMSEMELRIKNKKQREVRLELERVNSFKDRLLSIVSHDLRAPLNSIKGTLGMFEKGYLQPEEIKQLMGYLKLEANNTSQLLDNLLNWAKTKLDNFQLQKNEFDVNQVINETILLYKPEADRKNINLSFDQKENSVQVCGESEMIKLAIRNLINNSIKFCRDGDSIEVSAETRPSKSIVWIKDTGVGMTSEKLNKILGENTLESVPGTAKEKGIGLGLILINEFIKTNNGKIMATSMPNEGTTFRIELPTTC